MSTVTKNELEDLKRELKDQINAIAKAEAEKSRWTRVGPVVAILVIATGLVTNWASFNATLGDHEKRIRHVEETYVPMEVHAQRDKALDDRNVEMSRRMSQVEDKLDKVLQNQAETKAALMAQGSRK